MTLISSRRITATIVVLIVFVLGVLAFAALSGSAPSTTPVADPTVATTPTPSTSPSGNTVWG